MRTGNRFEEEPETAARFGIYTAVIWTVTFAVVIVLVFTVGWWWAPLAFIGGFAVMLIARAHAVRRRRDVARAEPRHPLGSRMPRARRSSRDGAPVVVAREPGRRWAPAPRLIGHSREW